MNLLLIINRSDSLFFVLPRFPLSIEAMSLSNGSVIDLLAILGPDLLVTYGETPIIASSVSVLNNGKVYGLLFSASWCPACSSFLPSLIKTCKQLKQEGKGFEVVLISFDEQKDKFDSYISNMKPCSVIPYDPLKPKEVAKRLGVTSLPTLMVVDDHGKVLSVNAKSAAADKPEQFPWEGYEEHKPSEWEVAMGGLKLAAFFITALSITLYGCYRGLRFTVYLGRSLAVSGSPLSMVLLLAVWLTVGYVLWKAGLMIQALVPILVKTYREETSAESASKHQEVNEAAAENKSVKIEDENGLHCKDGVCIRRIEELKN